MVCCLGLGFYWMNFVLVGIYELWLRSCWCSYGVVWGGDCGIRVDFLGLFD